MQAAVTCRAALALNGLQCWPPGCQTGQAMRNWNRQSTPQTEKRWGGHNMQRRRPKPTKNLIRLYFAPMKRMLPSAIWRPARALATGIITPIRFSCRTGHWKSSLRMSACSANGSPIPWYTYPAIDFLTQRNFKDRNVLEFGGGQSTLWWSARAQSVLTIEENADWCERLRGQIGMNVTLYHFPVDRTTRTVSPIKSAIDANPIRMFD